MKRCDRMLSEGEVRKCNKKAVLMLAETDKCFCGECAHFLSILNKKKGKRLAFIPVK